MRSEIKAQLCMSASWVKGTVTLVVLPLLLIFTGEAIRVGGGQSCNPDSLHPMVVEGTRSQGRSSRGVLAAWRVLEESGLMKWCYTQGRGRGMKYLDSTLFGLHN